MTRLLVLTVVCSLVATPGCVATVLDGFRADAMSNYLYFWVEDYEQPEIHVSWSHFHPTRADFSEAEMSPTELTIRPGLEGCQFVEVYVNDLEHHLESAEKAIQSYAVPPDTTLILDDRFPDCSVLLAFRRLESKPYFALSAVTRDGVVAEFENGKRHPAWLLLLPVAVVTDAAVILISIGGALAPYAAAVPAPSVR